MKKILQGLLLFAVPFTSQASVIYNYKIYSPSSQVYISESGGGTYPITGYLSIQFPSLMAPPGVAEEGPTPGYNRISIELNGSDYISFDITTEDFINGTGTYNEQVSIDYSPEGGYNQISDISGSIINLTGGACVECSTTFNFNSSVFNYVNHGSSLFPLLEIDGTVSERESEPLIYFDSSTDEFGGIINIREIYITPVPIPSSFWLLGSGLLLLVKFTRKKA
jgi:hypothetical protein